MKNNFLEKLKKEEKLELIDPSENIHDSYLEKSNNCMKAAKLLLQNKLYENSIGMSYYAMYDLLVALLFRVGIKCENHSAAILLLKSLFENDELFKLISNAKKERIDKQYYITTEKDTVTEEIAKELLTHAEYFVLNLKSIIARLKNEDVPKIREKFKTL
ncbi:DNA-binding protein [Candidatus Woesearchaeota archaeon CG10_big_fil_rev_8_21_14_0_10_37_12]|nr:MAG: DNA-binding protein [Candidatus Woesearchaeota archaeon CG10_big_fil_rev_8_21_14_0_10_37_12]